MLTETLRTPRKKAPPTRRADGGFDRLINNSQAVAQATRASYARGQTGRRRLVDPTTCERDYTAAELEFMRAMQEYKRRSGRMFPTWSEAFEVLQGLGYEQVASPGAETELQPTIGGGTSC